MNTDQQNEILPESGFRSRYEERRAARQQRRMQRFHERGYSYGGSWMFGAILIVVGVFIMLQNLTAFYLQNWWALILLIPAAGAFGNAWGVYQNHGQFNARMRATLIGGVALTAAAVMFMLGLELRLLGPLYLILVGLSLLVNMFLPE